MEIRLQKPLDEIWLKAAVVGSLWASVEIILGSFFHNLNIPFSGTILSFIGVYMLVSFIQIWKENGLIWRSGLICALMKSISPSAIILGPMIGIFTEAIILELFVFLFGKNLFGYMIGGSLAVFSTIVHKMTNLLITYGFDFINILESLYYFCVKQLRVETIRPVHLIIIICIIYLISGMVAAILGYFAGKKYMTQRGNSNPQPELTLKWNQQSFTTSNTTNFSIFFLLLNIIAVVCCLVLLNFDFIIPAGMLSFGYLAFVIYRYRNSLKRLKKFSIWIQFFLILLIASFLLTGISGDEYFSMTGLITGFKMIFRAILIIMGFSAISVELKNPVIKSILYRKGFASLYQSLGLAFSALPGIISSFPKPEKDRKSWHFQFSSLYSKAELLLLNLKKEHTTRPDTVIITGDIQQGKTTFVRNLADLLKRKGYSPHGFLAIAVHEKGIRTGFDLEDLQSSSRVELCRNTVHADWVKQGIYYFNPNGLKTGNDILDSIDPESSQLVIIDEVGPMEMNNQGWASAIERLCRNVSPLHLWVVRRNMVDIVSRKWNVGNIIIFDIGKDSVEAVLTKIEELTANRIASPK